MEPKTVSRTPALWRFAALVAVLAFAVTGLTAAAPAQSPPGGIASPADCADAFNFARNPVPVTKTFDGATVLASVVWGYNGDANLCYLVLDDDAVGTLRNVAASIPDADPVADEAAAERCWDEYNPDRGFAQNPVPVTKTADNQTTLASVTWGYNADVNLCYLVLDENAVRALRDAVPPHIIEVARGCDAPDGIACRIAEDGTPTVTRLMPFDEILRADPELDEWGHDHYPTTVSEDQVKATVGSCMSEWAIARGGKGPPRGLPSASPAATCMALVGLTAVSVDNRGGDMACVWDHIAAVYLRGEPEKEGEASLGWAETCHSRIDRHPKLPYSEACRLLAQTIAPQLLDPTVLSASVIPHDCRYDDSAKAAVDRLGRCGRLSLLAQASRAFARHAERVGAPIEQPDLVMPSRPKDSRHWC